MKGIKYAPLSPQIVATMTLVQYLTHAGGGRGGRGGRQTLSAQEQALNSVASKAVPAFLSHQMEI